MVALRSWARPAPRAASFGSDTKELAQRLETAIAGGHSGLVALVTSHGPDSPNARARVDRVLYLLAVAEQIEPRLDPANRAE